MADDKKPAPPAGFSELVTEWERNFNEFSNQIMGTEDFSRSMNQFQNVQMEMQRNFAEAMAKQLSNFNMPSRDDVVSIAQRLGEIEQQLDRIEKAQLRANGEGETKAVKKKGPARTKKPPVKKEAEKK